MFFLQCFLFLKGISAETSEEHAKIPVSDLYNVKTVSHPCAFYNEKDFERARHNSAVNSLAAARNRSIISSADSNLRLFTDSFIENFVPRTTPGSTTFCPNCEATGKKWHAAGLWSWKYSDPDHLKCLVCGMVFPNAKYPETIKIQSKWDPEQTISYVNNGPVKCMSYKICRSSLLGVIRGKKLGFFINAVYQIACGYPMTHDAKYAFAVKKGLLKLAQRLPKYLVYAGYSYSEYCDEDPHEAVKDPSKCRHFIYAPGNSKKEGEGLYDNYWAASRLGLSGSEGDAVFKIAMAYDFTVDAKDENGNNVYSEEEKKIIREKCVIEAALLCFYNTRIDNKAVENRKGAAVAGLATGSTLLARFGLDGFIKTINDWYLPDGGTPETVLYGLKALEGIYEFGFSFRNYSDPDDFIPPKGEVKYTNFNVNTDTRYKEIWQDLLWTSYGNYTFPPIGDSSLTTKLGVQFADFLNMAYNTTSFTTFVQEKFKNSNTVSSEGLFIRDLTQNTTSAENNTFVFPDIVLPYLEQGFLRTGYQGRESLIVLDASNYGNHRHVDSLNIVYWKDGRELLNDLGYLCDHVNKSQLYKTRVHNTVLINGKDQITRERNGSFHLFYSNGDAKIMQASSDAYKEASVYNRTITQINHHKSGKNYIVDIFRAKGGKWREYGFHGIHQNYTVNQKLNYKHLHKSIQYRACVKFLISSKTSFDISNAVLRPIMPDGTMGDNMVKPIPDNAFKPGGERCPSNGTWCYYIGSGKHEIRVEKNGPNGANSIHLGAVSPGSTGKYSFSLNIGNSNGHTGTNALLLDADREYYLEFYMKAEELPRIGILYWKHGLEDSSRGRVDTFSFKQTSSNTVNPDTWQKITGKIHIGPLSEIYGADFEDELKVKWDIDENYTFTSFTPQRNVNGKVVQQRVFYENGWGQRDNRNSDYGVTLPYFYIYREDENEMSTFVNVYEGTYRGEEIVNDVFINEFPNGNVGIKIDTKEGTDYVLSSFDGNEVSAFGLKTNADIAVQIGEDVDVKVEERIPSTPIMINGDYFESVKTTIKGRRSFSGKSPKEVNEERNSWYEIKCGDISDEFDSFEGLSIQMKGECGKNSTIERAYPIRKVERIDNQTFRFYTLTDSEGFRSHCHETWRIPYVAKVSFTPTPTPIPTTPTPLPTSNSSSPPQYSESGETKNKATTIIAVVIAVIVVVCAFAAVYFFVIRKRIAKSESTVETEEKELQNATLLV